MNRARKLILKDLQISKTPNKITTITATTKSKYCGGKWREEGFISWPLH